jgi:predicted enzyme related to lactoylglutathione lyase
MSDFNSQHNRVVWADIPVADVDRSIRFYSAVLDLPVRKEEMPGVQFGVFSHGDGNGGCLVPKPDDVSSNHGILVYLNVDGRIKDAVAKVIANGGKVVEEIHSIGPHGFRALIIDSEGNRLALHSNTDA